MQMLILQQFPRMIQVTLPSVCFDHLHAETGHISHTEVEVDHKPDDLAMYKDLAVYAKPQGSQNRTMWGFLIQKKGQMKSTSTPVDVLHHLSNPSQCLKSAQPPRTSGSHQGLPMTFLNIHRLSSTIRHLQQPPWTFNNLQGLPATFIDFQQLS